MHSQGLSRRDMLQQMSFALAAAGLSQLGQQAEAAPRVTAAGDLPKDARLGALKDLNGYFPFAPSATKAEWEQRKEYVRRQMLVACGIWPMPEQPAVKATVHGRVERDDYTVDRVFFESSPGLLVTGSLYRPKGQTSPRPTILCPHGHWNTGRFHDHGEAQLKKEIESKAETFEVGGRHPLQARCVQLARMGCNVFIYDMQGYADNGSFTFELIHRFGKQRDNLSSPERWGLFSAQSELRLINALGIQTWNSVRVLDWITTLPDVDTTRIGVTGASGGGTQTFIIAAIDDRIAAAFPAVMVSTAMQGGCTCENATYLRVNTGNIEFAAMSAPRPIAMTGANDWTVDIERKGLPELKQHFAMLGVPDLVDAKYMNFPHNYNEPSRVMMAEFFNRHFKLGVAKVVERDYVPLTKAEATVWSGEHKAPELTEDFEVRALRELDAVSTRPITALAPKDAASLTKFRKVIGGAIDIMVGRGLPGPDAIKYEKRVETEHSGYKQYTSTLRYEKYGEELPTVFLHPTNWNNQVVIWVGGDQGKSDLFGPDDKPTAAVSELLAKGFAVASADLLHQGEFLKDGQPLAQSRIVNNPREFAGFTLGYNHPLFAQRVQDVLTLITFVKHYKTPAQKIHLAGFGWSGLIAATACAQSQGAVASLAISTRAKRFGSITQIRDVNLFPGAVKYGDVPAILALCAPSKLWLGGEAGKVPALAAAAYAAASGIAQASTATEAEEALAAAKWIASA